MKIGILCNSVMALPAIQFLLGNGLALEVAMPDIDNADTPELVNFLKSSGIPISRCTKKDLALRLKQWIERYKIDVVFVITFPWRIPAPMLSLPKLGFFNFHYALLPNYKGAHPIFWQIRNGEPFGGLTIHRMDAGFDTGPIALQQKVPIAPGETYGMHSRTVPWQTIQAVAQFVQQLHTLGNAIPLSPQQDEVKNPSHRPGAADVSIQWATMTAKEVQQLVLACNPWNRGAYSFFGNSVFKIVQVCIKEHLNVYNQKLKPGTVINCSENKTIDIVTVDNNIVCLEIISVDEGIFTADFMARTGLKIGSELK